MKSMLLGLGLWLAPIGMFAQSYSIDWYRVAGGGGVSTGGVYAVSGTIGQHDAGVLSGGNYSLVGGFWGIIAAVATPGAPALTIALTSTNTVLISWPSPATGFGLQQNTALGTTNWSGVLQTPADNGVTRSVLVNPPAGNLYFRLKQ